VCCMCDPFLTSVRLRCFQEMYKKNGIADIYSLHSSLFTLVIGGTTGTHYRYTYTKKAPLVFSSPCLALGWLNTLALVWHPAIVANHYETHNKR
jgi:hypothetical protein